MFLNIGTRYENEKNAGVSHLLEKMLFKSTKTKSTNHITKLLDSKVVQSTTFHREQGACVADLLHIHLEEVVDLFSDCFINPLFLEEDIESAKQIIPLELEMMEEEKDKAVLLHDKFQELAFQNQSFGYPIVEKCIENINNLNHSTLKEFWNNHFIGSNIVISAVSVNHEAFVKLIQEKFGNIPKGNLIQPKKLLYTPGIYIFIYIYIFYK